MQQQNYRPLHCGECRDGADLDFDFAMALQPIVDVEGGGVYGHEALVRGVNEEPARSVLDHVTERNRYQFDQCCRVRAVETAASLAVDARLSINFLPNAVYRPELCIRTTLEACKTYGFPANRVIFELTEVEKVKDHRHLRAIVEDYRSRGFLTAIDDFGAGYAGLNLLAEFRTDIVKLDMDLIRGIDGDDRRRVIVEGMLDVCRKLALEVIAEGVETEAEVRALRSMGVRLFQGYYFARPAFRAVAAVPPERLRNG